MRDSFQQRHLDNSTRSKLFLATDKWPRYLQLAGSYITWEYIVKCTFGIVYVPLKFFLRIFWTVVVLNYCMHVNKANIYLSILMLVITLQTLKSILSRSFRTDYKICDEFAIKM